MKAIVRHQYGSPDVLQLEEVATPVPGYAEVLVKVHAAAVNMADVDHLWGRPKIGRIGTGLGKPKNSRLGLDVAGVVEAVGKDVAMFQPGDEVIGDLTEHGFGAFAERACASEAAFAPKPADITFEEAAAVPQAGIMALQGLRGRRQIQPGEQVLVNGAGGNVGPFAVQIAKSFEAEVTGVDHTEKLDMIRSIGADHVIDYTKDDYTRLGQHYDWILDVAAYRSVFESRPALRPNGVYVMIPATITGAFQALLVGPLLSLFGSRKLGMLRWRPFKKEDVAYLTELVEAGKLRPIIDRTYPLSEVPDALRYQGEGRTLGKVVITM